MKRRIIIIFFVPILLVITLNFSTQPANATPPFPELSGTTFPCYYDYSAAKMWDAGNTSQARNVILVSYGGSEIFQGPVIEHLNWSINWNTLQGTVWGTTDHEMFDVDGNHVGNWVGTIEGILESQDGIVWLARGKGVFHGEGLFEGLLMKTDWWQEPYNQTGEECGIFAPPGVPPLQVINHLSSYVVENTGEWPPSQ